MSEFYENACAVVDRPTIPLQKGSFWHTGHPVLNAENELIRGGMWEPQKAWWDLPNFIKLFVAGFGAGKTFIGAKRTISLALQNAPAPVAYVSPTFPLARHTGIATIAALLHGKRTILGRQFWWRYNKSTHEFFIRYRGRNAHIIVYSAEDPDSLRGPNLAGVWMDEPFIMAEEAFTHMMARIRHPDAVMKELLLTGCVVRNTKVLPASGMCSISSFDNESRPKEYQALDVQLYGSYRQFHGASHFFNNGLSETRKITVTNGYELEATPDHPVLVMGADGKPEWKKAEQLSLGDRPAIGVGADVWGNRSPMEGLGAALQATQKVRRHRYVVDPSQEMTADLAYFMGLWTAEGSIDLVCKDVKITCGDDATSWLERGELLGFKWSRCDNLTVNLNSVEFIALMKHLEMPLVTAPNKWIPQWVFSGKREWAIEYLSGLWDGDGHVCKDGTTIGYSTASKQLAQDVQLLLLNLGVVSHLGWAVTPADDHVKVASLGYMLTVTGNAAAKLAQILKLRIERKRNQLALYPPVRCSNKVPHQAQLVFAAWEKRIVKRWHNGESRLQPSDLITSVKQNKGSVAYATLVDFCNLWRANESVVVEEVERIEQNIADGYYWPKVTKLEVGQAETVDFVVPDTHSFWSNGFISHNTPEQLNWGYDLALGEKKKTNDVGFIQASTRSNLVTGPEYVKRLEGVFTDKAADAFIEGQFVNLGSGLVYYGFQGLTGPNIATYGYTDKKDQYGNLIPYIPEGLELGVGMDFNVDPMAATVFGRAGNHIHFFHEIELENADTEYLCSLLREWYVDPGEEKRVKPGQELKYVYPDASGHARRSSAPGGKTDYYYIKNAGFEIRAKSTNPLQRDRENAVNGKLRPKPHPDRPTCTIDPQCKRLIKYLMTFSHELRNTDKQKAMSHLIDAFGYPIAYLYPVNREVIKVKSLSGW
jgi:hypothetical protein